MKLKRGKIEIENKSLKLFLMRKYLKAIISVLILVMGFSCAFLCAENVTLCYHKFDDSLDDLYSVLPDVFEWQVGYIKKSGIPFVRLSDFQADPRKYISGKNKNVMLTADDGWESVLNVIPFIEKSGVPLSLALFPGVLNKERGYLTFEEIDGLKKNPWIDFCCHSYTHPVLAHLDDKSLNREVVDSRYKLEKLLGRKIDAFVYPYGMLDARSENLVKKNYKAAFGVSDGRNKGSADLFALNRYVIYRNTTFGEFIHIIDRLKNSKTAYSVKNLGQGRGTGKYFVFTKTRIFKFPVQEKKYTLVIVPNSHIGAGWSYKSIEAALKSGIQSYVIVNRNNNVPFYRPDKEMRSISSWGLDTYAEDLKEALDYTAAQNKKAVILTWNDGFDLVTSLLKKDKALRGYVKGVIAVNPSVLGIDSPKAAAENIRRYGIKIKAGEYSTESLKFFLRIKTMGDLAALEPDKASPFSQRLGYGSISNEELLFKALDNSDQPDLSLDSADKEYTMEDFYQAFMQPLPLFSMVVPLRYLRDINALYAGGANPVKGLGSLPVVYVYSTAYRANVKKFETVFPGRQNGGGYYFDDISTIEIMLSGKFPRIVVDNALKILRQKPR